MLHVKQFETGIIAQTYFAIRKRTNWFHSFLLQRTRSTLSLIYMNLNHV